METPLRAVTGARAGRLAGAARAGGDRDASAAGPGERLAPAGARRGRPRRGADDVVADAATVERIGVLEKWECEEGDERNGNEEFHYDV